MISKDNHVPCVNLTIKAIMSWETCQGGQSVQAHYSILYQVSC